MYSTWECSAMAFPLSWLKRLRPTMLRVTTTRGAKMPLPSFTLPILAGVRRGRADRGRIETDDMAIRSSPETELDHVGRARRPEDTDAAIVGLLCCCCDALCRARENERGGEETRKEGGMWWRRSQAKTMTDRWWPGKAQGSLSLSLRAAPVVRR